MKNYNKALQLFSILLQILDFFQPQANQIDSLHWFELGIDLFYVFCFFFPNNIIKINNVILISFRSSTKLFSRFIQKKTRNGFKIKKKRDSPPIEQLNFSLAKERESRAEQSRRVGAWSIRAFELFGTEEFRNASDP